MLLDFVVSIHYSRDLQLENTSHTNTRDRILVIRNQNSATYFKHTQIY